MRRVLLLLSVLGLLLAACGADPASTVPGDADAPSATAAVPTDATTDDVAGDDQPPATASETPSNDGSTDDDATADLPPAPDVPIPLADGTAISLSAIDKPVYLIFWAEW